jgi:hypothetical protein
MSTIPTPVRCLVRTEKHGKTPETVAVLYDIPGTNDLSTMTVFSPLEGHVTGTYAWIMGKTRPANASEIATMLNLLKNAGYHPMMTRKIPGDAILKRNAAIHIKKQPSQP